MTNKTKAELEAEIKKLKNQVEEKNREETYDKGAADTYALYASYIKAGFTEEQAWKFIEIIVTNTTAPNKYIH